MFLQTVMCWLAELVKESLPSALLTLLSRRGALGVGVGALPPPPPQQPPPALPLNMDNIPDNIKAHLLQQAFMQNNNHNNEYKQPTDKSEQGSDLEYDDTDDIVLPEDSETFYDNAFLGTNSNDSFDMKMESKMYARRDGSSSDDATRQFECRHCGKKYRWKSTLRRHENVECGGKAPAHQCPYCSYKAKQRGNLGVHIRKHHNSEWYSYATNKVRKNKKTPT